MLRRRCRRHSRRLYLAFRGHRLPACHFPASLRSTVITRFTATMDALTPAGRLFGPCSHELRSGSGRSPCFARLHFLPFCLQPPSDGGAAFLSLTVAFRTRTLSRSPSSRARETSVLEARATERTSHSARRLVPSSGRIEFTWFMASQTLLRTGSSPPAAPHPVSPRRSSLRSQAGESSA